MQQVLANPNVDCVKLSGHFNASNSETLQSDLQQRLLASHCSVMVLDMSDVESLDSDALMALVTVLNLAQEHGKSFALAGISPAVQIILEMTKLDQAFEVRDDLLQVQPVTPVALAA